MTGPPPTFSLRDIGGRLRGVASSRRMLPTPDGFPQPRKESARARGRRGLYDQVYYPAITPPETLRKGMPNGENIRSIAVRRAKVLPRRLYGRAVITPFDLVLPASQGRSRILPFFPLDRPLNEGNQPTAASFPPRTFSDHGRCGYEKSDLPSGETCAMATTPAGHGYGYNISSGGYDRPSLQSERSNAPPESAGQKAARDRTQPIPHWSVGPSSGTGY
jgi:hypothetical protein